MVASGTVRVAIDIDGVLTEHPGPLAIAASEAFGVVMPESTFIDSAGLNVPEEVRDWVYGPEGPAARLQPDPQAVRFLVGLIDLIGAENVQIVTARPQHASAMTEAWMVQHGLPRCEIVYADLKAAVALRNGLRFAVEDSLRHARNYAAAGVTCFVVKSGEQASNRFGTGDDQAIVYVDDLLGVLSMMEQDLTTRQSTLAAPVEASAAKPVTEMSTIVVSDAIHPAAEARLKEEAIVEHVDGTDRAALLAAIGEADALLVRSETQVDEEVLAAAPKLRVVARAGVGIDNIDVDAATRAGVLVLNTPGANAVSAAEHTIALLLGVTRQIPVADRTTRAGEWARKVLRPVDLKGKTVGIVGLGRVGSRVAKRLRAFEMNVIAYDPYISSQRFTEIGAAPVDYETLLHMSDVITFHVPSTPETEHMLDERALTVVKPGVIVINAARGEVVDQDALAAALVSGRVSGAGVDVFPTEPTASSPLFDLPNTVLTPHTGGSSAEALAAVGEVISVTTLAALRGEATPNAVNLPPASLQAAELQRLTSVANAAGHLIAVLSADVPASFGVLVDGQVPADVTEHVVSAALSAGLARWTNVRVTPVNSRIIAAENSIAVDVRHGDTDPDREPEFTIDVTPWGANTPVHHVAIHWDRRNAGIIEVDGFRLNNPLAGDILITHHHDQPGIIGQIGTILGKFGVNIAAMQVGRHARRGGEAIMVLNVDDEIPGEALERINAVAGIGSALVVSLPGATS